MPMPLKLKFVRQDSYDILYVISSDVQRDVQEDKLSQAQLCVQIHFCAC